MVSAQREVIYKTAATNAVLSIGLYVCIYYVTYVIGFRKLNGLLTCPNFLKQTSNVYKSGRIGPINKFADKLFATFPYIRSNGRVILRLMCFLDRSPQKRD